MLHLLDASVLITANHSYYPIDRIPEYWSWLKQMGVDGRVKIPLELFEEIREGPKDEEKDLLYGWLQDDDNRKALVLDEPVGLEMVQMAVIVGYATDLTDDEVEKVGRDPFLLAYAMVDSKNRRIVTAEVSRPSAQRANRRIPDVCASLGLECCDPHTMNKDLDFRTNWKAAVAG